MVIVLMVPSVGAVSITASEVGGNSYHLLCGTVPILTLSVAEVTQYTAGESTDNFCVRGM